MTDQEFLFATMAMAEYCTNVMCRLSPSEFLQTSSRTNTLKVKTACSNLNSVDHSVGVANLTSKNDIDENTLSTDNINKGKGASELPHTSAKEEPGKVDEEKTAAATPERSPVVQETDIDTDNKM